MKRRILFIINPVAGTRRKHRIPDKIERFLDHRTFEYDIVYTQGRGHATELAEQAASDGIEIVAIAGGDGSVNECATGLLDTETALAILPLGSGNGLARHLGYSPWVKSTLRVINAARIERIDVGRVNEHRFYSLIGLGFDAFVAKIFDREKTRGFATYAAASAAALMRYGGFEYELSSDVRSHTGRAFMINVFNSNQFGYDVQGAPDAVINDGQFNVVLVEPFPKWRAPGLVRQLLTGRHYGSPYVRTFQASRLTIHAPDRAHLHIDGEAHHKGRDFEIEVLPKRLRVLVNPAAHW